MDISSNVYSKICERLIDRLKRTSSKASTYENINFLINVSNENEIRFDINQCTYRKNHIIDIYITSKGRFGST